MLQTAETLPAGEQTGESLACLSFNAFYLHFKKQIHAAPVDIHRPEAVFFLFVFLYGLMLVNACISILLNNKERV